VRPVDWAALTLLAFEVPSLYFSQDRANSIGATEVIALSVFVYFAMRLLLSRASRPFTWIIGLAAAVALYGVYLASVGLDQFVTAARHLNQAGFTNLVAFRSRLIHPIPGWVPGECFTALLLTLPFACAGAAYTWKKGRAGITLMALVPAALIVATLFLSLSRAVFWSTILFFLATCGLMAVYKVIPLRTALFGLAGCLGATLLILGCESAAYPGLYRAYAHSQVSQSRSAEGRIDIWSRSLESMRSHPWIGLGSSNAALFLLSSAEEDETTGFASRSFSLPIQLLAEKGLVGFACYSAFLLFLCWEFHRGMRTRGQQANWSASATANRSQGKKRQGINADRIRLQTENARKAMNCCFAAGMLAVLFRELAYSSLLEHTLTLALTFGLAALMCTTSQSAGLKIIPLAIVAAVVVLAFQWPYLRCRGADAKLSEFYAQVHSADFIAARATINEAIRLWPWDARYYGWRGYVTSQQLPSECLRNTKTGAIGIGEGEKTTAEEAVVDYRHALALNGRDAVAHHDGAWLEHLLGDDAAAARDWKEAVEIDPDNPAFHLSYGMFLEESGSVEAARAEYESAVELTPSTLDSPFFSRYRSRSSAAADALVTEVAAKLEARLSEGNDPILEARLGKIDSFRGDFVRAQKLLEDASRQLPNLPLVWLNLGDTYQAEGDFDRARTSFEKARDIDASLAAPFLRIGELHLRVNDRNDAVHDFNEAVLRWQQINPITSAHNNRLYDGPRQQIDDLLPTTLVWFISPCEASEAWSALSKIYPQNAGYAERARTCEEIPAPHSGVS
jgi:tetratricopeptide (TPR) repeat protein